MVQYIIIAILTIIAITTSIYWYKAAKKLAQFEERIITVSDSAPEKSTPKNRWLQLTNEGKKYVKTDNNKVYLTILK